MKSLVSVLVLMLCASVALADSPQPSNPATSPSDEQKAASKLLEEALVVPLRKAERRRSKFSRAAPVARERRVRVHDAVAQLDARGKPFVRFTIDVHDSLDEDPSWQLGAIVGCVYTQEREVYIQRGEHFVPAAGALGKSVKAVPDVCRAPSA